MLTLIHSIYIRVSLAFKRTEKAQESYKLITAVSLDGNGQLSGRRLELQDLVLSKHLGCLVSNELY